MQTRKKAQVKNPHSDITQTEREQVHTKGEMTSIGMMDAINGVGKTETATTEITIMRKAGRAEEGNTMAMIDMKTIGRGQGIPKHEVGVAGKYQDQDQRKQMVEAAEEIEKTIAEGVIKGEADIEMDTTKNN